MTDTSSQSLTKSIAYPSLREDVLWIVLVFSIWRTLLTVWAGLINPPGIGLPEALAQGHPVYKTYRLAQPATGSVAHFLLDPWYRWDAGWYLKIAMQGYAPADGSLVFPPLYPLLVRWVTPWVGHLPLLAAILISNMSCLGALLLLKRYLHAYVDHDVARWSVLVLAVFPASLFLLSPYTEPLYLLLALGALLASQNQKWGLAGSLACLAAFARLPAIVLVAPLACAWWRAYHSRWSARAALAGVAILGAPIGVGVYLLWVRATSAGWSALQSSQFNYRFIAPPYQALVVAAKRLVSGQAQGLEWVSFVVCIGSLMLGLWMIREFPATLWSYAWASLLVSLTLFDPVVPLHAFMRYATVNFPIAVAVAYLLRDRRWLQPLTMISSGALQLFFVWLYVHWYAVG